MLEVGKGAANIMADINLSDLVLTDSKCAVRLDGHAPVIRPCVHLGVFDIITANLRLSQEVIPVVGAFK